MLHDKWLLFSSAQNVEYVCDARRGILFGENKYSMEISLSATHFLQWIESGQLVEKIIVEIFPKFTIKLDDWFFTFKYGLSPQFFLIRNK